MTHCLLFSVPLFNHPQDTLSRKDILRYLFGSDYKKVHKEGILKSHLFEYLSHSHTTSFQSKLVVELKKELGDLLINPIESHSLKKIDLELLQKLSKEYPRIEQSEQNLNKNILPGDIIAYKKNAFGVLKDRNPDYLASLIIYKIQSATSFFAKKYPVTVGSNHVTHFSIAIEVEKEEKKTIQWAESQPSFTKGEYELRRIDPLKEVMLPGDKDEYKIFRFFAENKELEKRVRKSIHDVAWLFTEESEYDPDRPPIPADSIEHQLTQKNYSYKKAFSAIFKNRESKDPVVEDLNNIDVYLHNKDQIELKYKLLSIKSFCSYFSYRVMLAALYLERSLFPNHEVPKYYFIDPQSVTPAIFYTLLKGDEMDLKNKVKSFGFRQVSTFVKPEKISERI